MSGRQVDGLLTADAPVIATKYDPRSNLLVSSWIERALPERDYLLGTTICSTSRWLLFGDTGVGKTLFSFHMAGAISAGMPFLNWKGRGRRSRVMYLDGELPAETFKDRVELVTKNYGSDIPLYGYNREWLGDEAMSPLNTDIGQNWLLREIEAIRPDAIFFDSIMSLLTGSMSDEENWTPVKAFIRKLSSKRIAQVWLHHTGHDAGRSFGTKTREWEMDTVVSLAKNNGVGSDQIRLEFRKARLRKPENTAEFAPQTIRYTADGWVADSVAAAPRPLRQSGADAVRNELLNAYDSLAAGVAPGHVFDGASVRKVPIARLRDELRSRQVLKLNEEGQLTSTSRTHFHRARSDLTSKNLMVEADGFIWRISQ